MIRNQLVEVVTRKRAFFKSETCNLQSEIKRVSSPTPRRTPCSHSSGSAQSRPASDIPPARPALSISQCKGDVVSDESCGVIQKRHILRPNKDCRCWHKDVLL